jgi:hypothetical protein
VVKKKKEHFDLCGSGTAGKAPPDSSARRATRLRAGVEESVPIQNFFFTCYRRELKGRTVELIWVPPADAMLIAAGVPAICHYLLLVWRDFRLESDSAKPKCRNVAVR